MRGHSVSGSRKFNRHWQSGGTSDILVGDIIYTCTGATPSDFYNTDLVFECTQALLDDCHRITRVEYELYYGNVPSDIIISPFIGIKLGYYDNNNIEYRLGVDGLSPYAYIIVSGFEGSGVGGQANVADVQSHYYGETLKLVTSGTETNSGNVLKVNVPVGGKNTLLGTTNSINIRVTPQSSGEIANQIINSYCQQAAYTAYQKVNIYGK